MDAVDASSVLLLREPPEPTGSGLEVLLLERSSRSAAFAGAFVFPGGKVDAHDRDLAQELTLCDDPEQRRAELQTASQQEAMGFLIAAVRETFEESGVLLARRDGRRLTASDVARPSFHAARARLASRDERWDWAPWLCREGLQLDLDAVHMWAWWLTPIDRPHRFDTRFFVTILPQEQRASHDQVETTSLRWLDPAVALAERDRSGMHLRPATISNLESLLRYPSPAAVVEAARRGEVDRRRVLPPPRAT